MKFTLKLLILLAIILACMYAATPLWLSYMVARQLPGGWQLETLQADYPGLSGLHINALRITGGIETFDFTLSATDLDINYQGMTTVIDSVGLDIHVPTVIHTPDDAPSMQDLSLPVIQLSEKMPELTVHQLRVALQHAIDAQTTTADAARPLALNLAAFTLTPHPDNRFHLTTNMGFEGFPEATGRIDMNVNPGLFKADIQFPADLESAKWLAVLIEQKNHTANTTTSIQASFDAASANREWLDSILALGSGGWLTSVNGKLEIDAGFSGQSQQDIEHLSLSSEQLQLISSQGILDLKAELHGRREHENIIIELPVPAEIRYRDETGRIDQLLADVIPGFQRAPRSAAEIFSVIDSGSRFQLQPDSGPAIDFNGSISIDLAAGSESFKLHSDALQLEMGAFPRLESITANGLITLDWQEGTPFAYTSEALNLKADQLSLNAQISAHDGRFISTGRATVMAGQLTNPITSATKTDIRWRDFDLFNTSGHLSTQTLGFKTEVDGETWKGFDFDITYDILNAADVSGSGTLTFASGPHMPIEFSGNAQTEKWNIRLPLTTVKVVQLKNLLGVAHISLPGSVKLTSGHIELVADVMIGNEMTIKMTINGYGMDASMLESSVHQASFSLNTAYDRSISASGPVLIETIALAGGIDLTQVKADLEIENSETIGLQNLYAELFEGQVRLAKLRYSNQSIEDTTAALSHINLGRILEFVDIGGLEGTGSLDISLPIGSDQTGLHIKDGTFQSIGPGRLAYTNQGVAAGNIGLQALENFLYKSLSGAINYQSNGDYQIKVRLEGKNPDLYDGYPVIFNLNISGSLPALFEALFITGSFEDAVLKEIKNR